MPVIALITGASGGIGRALARQLHDQGCHVAAVGRDAGRLADVAAAVRIAADRPGFIAACADALAMARGIGKTPAEHENPKTHWRYVQRAAASVQPPPTDTDRETS